MTIREFLTVVLEKNRQMEIDAKNQGDYAKALKKQGAVEITELIYSELDDSPLFDKKIR